MLLTIENICSWAQTNASHRNFIEGKRVLEAKHIISIGKNIENKNEGCVSLTALCLQTSHLKESPHEITGELRGTGEIISMKCSCKAGLGEKCKHVIATLLLCSKNDFETFPTLSSTDLKCKWKKGVHDQALAQYVPIPLEQHECFGMPEKKYKLCDEKVAVLQAMIFEKLPNCAISKRKKGRHSPVIFKKTDDTQVTEKEIKAMEIIFSKQDNKIMEIIEKFPIEELKSCCQKTQRKLVVDVIKVCIETKQHYSNWHNERRFRITGSTCYGLYTYTKNKKPDWKKKCHDHITPKNFSNEFTEYGKVMEGVAREKFKQVTKKEVVETGLIVSKINPWLAYSPDGVIFDTEVPSELLEIKCPSKGKTNSILDTVQSEVGKSLEITEFGLQLKKKHKYYGQVQLGMAIVNVRKSAFVMYSAFDKNVFILEVKFDDCFVLEMLTALKSMYFNIMLHEICSTNDETKENDDNDVNKI